MQKFRPMAMYEGFREDFKKAFPTYRELKKALPEMLKASRKNVVCVIRWKNNWQYFENWRMEEGKPRIVKEGYM